MTRQLKNAAADGVVGRVVNFHGTYARSVNMVITVTMRSVRHASSSIAVAYVSLWFSERSLVPSTGLVQRERR